MQSSYLYSPILSHSQELCYIFLTEVPVRRGPSLTILQYSTEKRGQWTMEIPDQLRAAASGSSLITLEDGGNQPMQINGTPASPREELGMTRTTQQ